MTAVHVTLTVTDAFLFCVKKFLMYYSTINVPLNVLFNFIVNPNKPLYFLWYPDVFFPSVAFNLVSPFLKKCPEKNPEWRIKS